MANSRLDAISQSLKNNSPTILSGAAVAGVVTTAILAAKASVKIHKKTEGLEQTPKEKLQSNWKELTPPVISGVATIACIVGANQIGLRRNAALVGAYTLVDKAFREYKDEVLNQITPAREQKIQDEINKRAIDENPPKSGQVIITGGGDQLCFDKLTGRYFKNDIETVRRAANDINQTIVGGNMYASLNEFHALIGLDPTDVGEELGFNLEHFVDLGFTSHLAKDGTPCIAIYFKELPVKDYGKVF